MAGLEITSADVQFRSGYLAPSCEADGLIRSTLFHPDGYSLWELEAELDAGAEVRWHSPHGDEVVYVLDGEIEVGGLPCGRQTAAVVEEGVATELRALTRSRVLHFGPVSAGAPCDGPFGPPLAASHRVHTVGPPDARRVVSEDGTGGVYYADATCPTCRLAFFEVFSSAPWAVSSHTHSQDEIIRVVTGELRIGQTTVGPAMSVAIPGGYRYGFRTPGPVSFLNYRRDASLYVGLPGSAPIVESAEAAARMGSER